MQRRRAPSLDTGAGDGSPATADAPNELQNRDERPRSLGKRRAASQSQWTSIRRITYVILSTRYPRYTLDAHRNNHSTTSGVGSFQSLPTDPRENVLRRLQKLWRGRDEAMAPSRPSAAIAVATLTSEVRDAWRAPLAVLERTTCCKPPELYTITSFMEQSCTLPRTDSAAIKGSVAGQVFAIRALWSAITDFMPGLPFVVLQFERRVSGKYVVRDRNAYRSSVFFELEEIDDWFPKPEGLLLHLAIAEDNLEILRILLKLRVSPRHRANPKLRFDQAMRCAIWNRRWRILRWLASVLPLNPDWRWEPDLMSYAVVQHNFSLMSWLFNVCPSESVILSARRVEVRESDDLEMVMWLHEHHYAFSEWMMNSAAAKGSLEVVEFLHRHRAEGCTAAAMDLAARYGHLPVVQFLHANRTEGCSSSALDGAAQNGHLEVAKFLLESRVECCVPSAIKFACENNHRDVAELLRGYLKD